MPADDSISRWIGELKQGDAAAAQQELWNRYFHRLIGLARKLLRGVPQRSEDEEDVVLNALNSFFRGAAGGRFPDLHDGTDLWPLLVKITAHKALNQMERQRAEKRGGGKVRGESVFVDGTADSNVLGIEQVIAAEPTPDFAIQMAENCQRLLDVLEDDALREVARLKLEGYNNVEISERLGIVERTVERRLNRIRRQWAEECGL